MKKNIYLKWFLLWFLMSSNCLYATDIWKTNFADDVGKGYYGDISNFTGIIDWSLDISNCILADANDYVKVVGTGGGRFEAKDCDGEAVWKSKVIDISGFSDVSLSVLLAETGSSVSSNKYVKAFYILNGGEEISFSINNENTGNWGGETATQSGLNGSSIQIIIRLNNPNSGDLVYFDNILISNNSTVVDDNTSKSDVSVDNLYATDSFISSLCIDEKDAVEVFRFSVNDQGSDDVSTILEKIRLIGSDKNKVNWKKSIEQFILKVDGDVLDVATVLDKDELEFQFPESEVKREIPNKGAVEYSVYCFLKEGKTIDEELFQMEIDSLHSNWEVSESGSGLQPIFTGNLTGTEFIFEVKGKKMVFEEVPKSVNYKEEFELIIELQDSFGNIDTNSEFEIELLLASGKGELISENLKMPNGNTGFHWSNLSYTEADNFTIQAECANFPSILSDNISGVDRTSVIGLVNPISASALSSLAITQDEAIPVLNFKISDGATHDQLATIISNLKFYNAHPENSFSWAKHIGGAVLLSDAKILAVTSDIENDYIGFNSSKGVLEIPNNSEMNLSLAIFFRKGQLPDNLSFEVQIPEKHDWKTIENSSGLQEILATKIGSQIHVLHVKASGICFASYPFGIYNPNEKFALKVIACDEFNNIDKDAIGSVQLSLITGEGELIIPNNSLQFENGSVHYDSLQYNGSDDFHLKLESAIGRDSIKILHGEDELSIDEDFEEKNLDHWMNTEDWDVSSYRPIDENYSLKHNLTVESGASYISTPLVDFNPRSSAINWSFIIRNGNWNPSSGNKFAFHLLMDDSNPELASIKYSVGVNQKGSSDVLSLWALDKDKHLNVLMETEFNWNENDVVAINLSYQPDGVWKMAYNRLGIKENWLDVGEIKTAIDLGSQKWFSGLEFSFETASRAGNLWFDDLEIQSYNRAPFLKSYKIVGKDSILLEYSEDLDFEKSSRKGNFKLARLEEEIFDFNVLQGKGNNCLLLVLDEELKTGDYSLEISYITDAKGARQKVEAIHFGYFAPAKKFDVVINEIMVDESPIVGLPEYEFIELYNNSDYPVSVENWILKVGEKESVLGRDTIDAKGYLILCPKSATDQFVEFGDVLGVSNFYGLSNSVGVLEIRSDEKLLIDKVGYTDSWYQSAEKIGGGWSLERIDPKNTSWQENNWKASISNLGGTPGTLNSIYSENKDILSPILESCRFVFDNCIKLVFSEPIECSGILELSNFQLDSDLIHPNKIIQLDHIGKEFQLCFQSNFITNSQYQLTLSDQIADLAGNYINIKEYDFSIPGIISEGDLVINEVLFNPYSHGSDYVEIVNVSEKLIDLSQVELATRNDNLELFEEVSISDRYLHPQEYFLITEDTIGVQRDYFTSNSHAFCQIKSLPLFPDEAGRVVLVSNNMIVDDFAYNEDMHFDLLASLDGVSLERINPMRETNSPSNWQSAAQNIGFGTPGLKNSVYKDIDVVDSEISLSSKIFSPDNDGFEDRLLINFKMKEDGYLTSIRIFNSMGIEIRKLASNVNLANEDFLYWDGLTSKKERAPIGIYLVYIELFNSNGEVRTYKKTCVLGGKFN